MAKSHCGESKGQTYSDTRKTEANVMVVEGKREGMDDVEECGGIAEKFEELQLREESDEPGLRGASGAEPALESQKAGEEVQKMKAEDEGIHIKRLIDPRKPSKKEVEEHVLKNHGQYRNWCPICVKAKGRDLDHRADATKERGLSEYSFDYCFPGDEFGSRLTTLVGRERKTGMLMATSVPMKGSTGRFTLDNIFEFFEEVGDTVAQLIIKTDQEPSMKSLVDDVVAAREEGRTLVEESPKQSSGSNGVAERAVQEVEGQMRVILLALEENLGEEVKPNEPLVQFIPEFAAYVTNRMAVGKDGKTNLERVKGKRASLIGLEFGEKLLWKLPKKDKMAKLRERWCYGIYVGVRRRSGEFWVADKDGDLHHVRSVRRILIEERWGGDNRRWVRRVPWNKYEGDEYEDGALPDPVDAENPVQDEGLHVRQPVRVQTRDGRPRDFQIKKKDVEKYGVTRGCAGCSSWYRGLARQPHNDRCRERFRELLKDEARTKLAGAKRKEFEKRIEDETWARIIRKQGKSMKREAQEEAHRRAGPSEVHSQRHDIVNSSSSTEGANEQRKRKDEEPSEQCSEEHADTKRRRIQEIRRLVDEVRRKSAEVEEVEQIVCSKTWEVIMEIGAVGCGKADDEEGGEEIAWDDVKGGRLKAKDVQKARKEEVTYMQDKQIWEVCDEDECWERTGAAPVAVRWVDTNKGTEEEPQVRSRLVARDFKDRRGGRRDNLYAATPPLKGLRMLWSKAAAKDSRGKRRMVLILDAKMAHLNPPCQQDVYIELPAEANAGEGKCGKLKHWIYGMRPAAHAWEEWYSAKLAGIGFERGKGCGVVFQHKAWSVSALVHGDDFIFVSGRGEWKAIETTAMQWCEMKVRGRIGEAPSDDKHAVVLGRDVRWTPQGIEYEADRGHRAKLMDIFGFDENSKSANTSGEKAKDRPDEEEEKMSSAEAKQFRAAVALLNYYAQDCPDVQFAAKEAPKHMANPGQESWGGRQTSCEVPDRPGSCDLEVRVARRKAEPAGYRRQRLGW